MTQPNFVPWNERLAADTKSSGPTTTVSAEPGPSRPGLSYEVERVIAKQNFFKRQGLQRGTKQAILS